MSFCIILVNLVRSLRISTSCLVVWIGDFLGVCFVRSGMDLSTLTSYVSSSPFVREYALEGGLDSSLPASDVVNTSERVVLVDVLLRKH